MKGIIVVLAALVIIEGVRMLEYRRQIAAIIDQMRFLEKEDTNLQVSSCCRIRQMEQLIREINQIREKDRRNMRLLKKENRSYRESITSISHDIRTPLTSAKGYTQMLLSGGSIDEKKQKVYIQNVNQRIDDVTDMLNQLFEYARMEADELEFACETMKLNTVFADTLSLFYQDFVKKGCEPTVELQRQPCYIAADPQAVKRIIENLVKNALVHGIGGYRFSLHQKEEQVELLVSNRTDSIEPSDIAYIFERFYTTDRSRTRKTTGLGLAIVKKFTEKMGGSVQAFLEEDVFTVAVRFPLVAAPVESI